jgi:hypothetical protein
LAVTLNNNWRIANPKISSAPSECLCHHCTDIP